MSRLVVLVSLLVSVGALAVLLTSAPLLLLGGVVLVWAVALIAAFVGVDIVRPEADVQCDRCRVYVAADSLVWSDHAPVCLACRLAQLGRESAR